MSSEVTHRCEIDRKSPRGDYIAVLVSTAFSDPETGENDASGPWATGWRGFSIFAPGEDDEAATVRVRFGARAGAILAALPDEDRAAVVVASVREARERWPKGYKNDARAGAIPLVVVALATKTAKTVRQGAGIRVAFGRYSAARRVVNAPAILGKAAEKFHTVSPFEPQA